MNRKTRRHRKISVTKSMEKRLDAIKEHLDNCREAMREDRWRSAVDEMSKAETLARNAKLDALSIDRMMKDVDREKITFVGIDVCNRPIFQSIDNPRNFFGACDRLFDLQSSEDDVLKELPLEELTFFGSYFGCEPMGTQAKNIQIVPNGQVEKMPTLYRTPKR